MNRAREEWAQKFITYTIVSPLPKPYCYTTRFFKHALTLLPV